MAALIFSARARIVRPMEQRVGPYLVERTVGMGGMGEVLLATLERPGGFAKRVALKRLLPRWASDPAFLTLFEREARLAAALDHRNIVQIFDFGHSPEGAWLAMEFVHGVDLKAVMDQERGPLPLEVTLEIALGCARALDYAHRAVDARGQALGVVHGDVSPHNVLLSFEGDVKLADFGLARASAWEEHPEGGVRGKLAYLSPEQARGKPATALSDQFSLGVALFECLTGVRAFFDPSSPELVLERIRQGLPPAPLASLRRDLPASLCATISRAMAPDPAERFANAGALLNALEQEAAALRVATPLRLWLSARFSAQAFSGAAACEATASASLAITSSREPPTELSHRALAPRALEVLLQAPTQPELSPLPVRERRWPLALALALALIGGVAWRWTQAPRTEPKPQAPQPANWAGEPEPVQTLGHLKRVTPVPRLSAPTPDVVPIPAPKPEVVEPKPEVVEPKPEVVEPKPEVVKPKPEVVEPKPEVAKPKPEVVEPKPEVIEPKPEVIEPKPEVVEPSLPRFRLSGVGTRFASSSKPQGGWYTLSDAGTLVDVFGGGPPVRLRVRSLGSHFEATVDARPWGEVKLDDQPLGQTPVASVPLKPGRRHLSILGPEGRATELTLEVAP